jgi:signal transduction histidine kinase
VGSVNAVVPAQLSQPLAKLLRVGFGLVVVAAVTVDWWASRGFESRRLGALLLIAAVVAGLWVARPTARNALVLAPAACLVSLLITAAAGGYGGRLPFFTDFVVLPILFCAALFSSSVARWPVTALLAVSGEAVALRADYGPIRWILAIAMLVLLAGAASAAFYVRLREQERRASVDAARQDERLELARELHDIVGHHITGIVVLAQASRFANATPSAAHASDIDGTLEQIETAGIETLSAVRRIVGLLRTGPAITPLPDLADIENLADTLRLTHPDTTLVVDEATRARWVPATLANTLERVMQEATTNVRKHGDRSAPVRIDLRQTDGHVAIAVDNQATGGPSNAGYGLVGMRERVESLGGVFAADLDTGGGWHLRVTLPVGPER